MAIRVQNSGRQTGRYEHLPSPVLPSGWYLVKVVPAHLGHRNTLALVGYRASRDGVGTCPVTQELSSKHPVRLLPGLPTRKGTTISMHGSGD